MKKEKEGSRREWAEAQSASRSKMRDSVSQGEVATEQTAASKSGEFQGVAGG